MPAITSATPHTMKAPNGSEPVVAVTPPTFGFFCSVTPLTLVLGDGAAVLVAETVTDGETDGEAEGDVVTVGETEGDTETEGETDGDGEGAAAGQLTQNTLCFTSAPCAPGAWIVSLRCHPCWGCGATPEF